MSPVRVKLMTVPGVGVEVVEGTAKKEDVGQGGSEVPK